MIKSKNVASFVAKHCHEMSFPADATDIRLIGLYLMQVQGQSSRLYVLSTSYRRKNRLSKKDLVLKTSRNDDEERIAKEYRTLKALKTKGIPVPTAIALELDPKVIGTPFMIMEKINGPCSSNFLNNREDALAIVDMLAQLVASLHKVDSTVLFGTDLIGDKGAQSVKFRETVLSELRDKISSGYITSLSPFTRQKYLEAVKKLGKMEIQRSPASLIHADLGPDHVLLSDKGPVVIDWEGIRIGDPAYDLGWLYHVIGLEGQMMIDHRFVRVSKGASLGFDIGKEFVECYRKQRGFVPANLEFYKNLAALKLSVTLDLHIRPGFACLSRISRLRPTEVPSQTILAYGTIRSFKRHCDLYLRDKGIL